MSEENKPEEKPPEKRFHVNGVNVHDRMNSDRVAVECLNFEEAELWAATANDHHDRALKPIGRDR